MEPRLAFSALRLVVEVNVLLAGGLLLARAYRGGSHAGRLRFAQALFVLAFALPLATRAMPAGRLAPPAAQVWSSGDVGRGGGRPVAYLGGVAPRADGAALALDGRLLGLAAAALAAIAVARFFGLLVRLALLERALDALPRIREIGRVRVVATDAEPVPYSAWLFGRAFVAIPGALAADASRYAIAVRHEIAHHRQRDTLWVQLFEAAACVAFWNPALRRWSRLFTELMELACDEALVTRRRVDPGDYARCLVETARAALAAGAPSPAFATTGMAAAGDGFLKRRIEIMLSPRAPRSPRALLAPAAALVLLAGSALALEGAIQDRVIGMARARELAARAQTQGFRVVMNDRVLERLNRLVATPEGREFLSGALARMPGQRPQLEGRLGESGLPLSLVAVALVESGFRNNEGIPTEPTVAPGMRGAGVWMFIPATARRYGLAVDPAAGIDERLDVAKETGAAIAYLGDLQRQFGDWHLALAAYNQGEQHVARVVAETGVRDPFVLADRGQLNDYLATVMAGVVILANPEIAE